MKTFASLVAGRSPVLGTWIKLPATESVELMALAGFDFVVIDLEHSPMSLAVASTSIAVAIGRGIVPLVRVPDHTASWLQRVLDAGAAGVVVPHVDSLDQARAVRGAARFEPRGTRGVGPTSRAGDWGLSPMQDYLQQDTATVVIAQIESMAGVDSVPALLQNGAVDAILVGAADLSVSLGLRTDDPQIVEIVERVLDQCRAAAVPCGTAIGADGARAAELTSRGFSFVVTGNDATLLGTAGRDVVSASRRHAAPTPLPAPGTEEPRQPPPIDGDPMSTATASTAFTRPAPEHGAAAGVTITGKQNPAAVSKSADGPLIIALPGGAYTSDYFDIPGYSLLDAADAMGVPVIAIDRPAYGGSTPLPPSESIIASNAAVLDAVVADIWGEWSGTASGVVLIGHSIGGAIVTDIAANHPAWPLKGIAVSGCLLDVPPESVTMWAELPDIPMIDLPEPLKDQFMFGPAGSFASDMPAASHPANAECPRAELIDITTTWVARVRDVAARVEVPVLSRQGELDALWITDADRVAAFGASFTGAPSVDAELVPGVGHCLDFHTAGAALRAAQLDFAQRVGR